MKTSLVNSLAFLLLATSAYSPLEAMDESEEFTTAQITVQTAGSTATEEETAGESVTVPAQTGAGIAPQTGAGLLEEIENDPKLLAIHARIDEELRTTYAQIEEALQARRAQIEEEFLAEQPRIEEELQERHAQIEKEFLADLAQIAETAPLRAETGAGAGAGVVDETTDDAELSAQLEEATRRLNAKIASLAIVRVNAESAAKEKQLIADYLAETDANKARAKAKIDARDARAKAEIDALKAHGEAKLARLEAELKKSDAQMARWDAELARQEEEEAHRRKEAARREAENLAELDRLGAEHLAAIARLDAESARLSGAGAGAGIEVPEHNAGSTTVLAPTTPPAVQAPPAKKSGSS